MWGTDATATRTVHDGPVTVFVAVDHCASEAIGLHAVRRHFGGPAPDAARGLSLRHDHGSQYMSRRFQQEIGFLGIRPSPSFVREPVVWPPISLDTRLGQTEPRRRRS